MSYDDDDDDDGAKARLGRDVMNDETKRRRYCIDDEI